MIRLPLKNVDIADRIEFFSNPKSRAIGLLKYQDPPSNYAAIFSLGWFGFFPLIHTFGMRFSIDMVFCDSAKRVLAIFRNVEPGRMVIPWKYFFGGCRYLVECSMAKTHSIEIGDTLSWGNP